MIERSNHYKKTIVLFLYSLLFVCISYAEGYYNGNGMMGKRLAVFEPDYINISNTDKYCTSDLVSIIRMDLRDYAGFTVIDSQNLKRIKELQAQSENDAFSSNSQLRAGLLQFAEYEAFIRVTKSGNSYSLGLSITDITTGEIVAEHIVSKISNITEIETKATQTVIKNITQKLGITLTSRGLYALNGGDSSSLSIEEQTHFANQDVIDLQSSLDSYNKQLKSFNTSNDLTDQNIAAAKAKLETEKQITEYKLEIARQKELRLKEQAEREKEEELAALQRSQKAEEKIDQLSQDVEKTAEKIRQQSYNSMSIIEQINVIEKEKRAYVEIRDRINSEIEQIKKDTTTEYNKTKKDPNDLSNYKALEIDPLTGKPQAVAVRLIEQENQELYEKLIAEQNQNIKKIHTESDKQLKEILTDIKKKQDTLRKKQTINSLTMPGMLNIRKYNLSTMAWDGSINFIVDGKNYLSESVTIDFNSLCNAIERKTYTVEDMTGVNGRQKYNNYVDTASAYDSMFRMNAPFVYVEADIGVTALDINHPSQYELKVYEYRFYYTDGKKLIKTMSPVTESKKIDIKPVCDIRTAEQKTEYYKNYTTKESPINNTVAGKNNLTGGYKSVTAYGFYTKGIYSGWGLGYKMDLGLNSHFYLGGAIDYWYVENNTSGIDLFCHMGLNLKYIYSDLGAGLNFNIRNNNYIYDYSKVSPLLKAGVGLSFYPSKKLHLNIGYESVYSSNIGFNDKYIVGIYGKY